mgnify:CR=1 FL=1
MSTGTFDHDGQMTGGDASGSAVNLSFPRFEYGYAKRIADGIATAVGAGGNQTMYSASFTTINGVQDYDLQTVISSSAASNSDEATGDAVPYAGLVGNKKVRIEKVFYKTPQSMWRFYGYYGGLNVVGNLNYYGQFSDDTTFEIIPSWHNKLQATAYEDHLWTRLSHYSYEIHNNKLRLFPIPDGFVKNMWVQFSIDTDGWTEDADRKQGVDGINNMNTLPFDNVPYQNINAIGKQWIRKYTLALVKEMLGGIRGKYQSLPIPGETTTLDYARLLQEASAKKAALIEELRGLLDETTRLKQLERKNQEAQQTQETFYKVPYPIYVG